MTLLLPVAAGATLVAGVGSLLLLRVARRQEALATRLRSVQGDGVFVASDAAAGRSGFLHLVASLGAALARSGLLSSNTLLQLQQTLVAAGLRGPNGLGLFVGSKLLLLICLPLLTWLGVRGMELSPLVENGALAAACAAGLLLPDYFVRSRRAAALRKIEAGLPDALDLMVICSEAGLGLEPALARVAIEIEHAHPLVAEELTLTAHDLRLTSDRRAALLNMGGRTGLDSLKRLGVTLVQTLQYGTPLSQALRLLSAEMRGEMLIRFEERAARLPVLLTVPMILFILPTVFMVVGGPAMLSVLASMHK